MLGPGKKGWLTPAMGRPDILGVFPLVCLSV